jgi:hypothetical protein
MIGFPGFGCGLESAAGLVDAGFDFLRVFPEQRGGFGEFGEGQTPISFPPSSLRRPGASRRAFGLASA